MVFSKMKYSRPDADSVLAAYDDLIARQRAAKSGEEQLEIHSEYYELNAEITSLQILAVIRHSINTADEFYSGEVDFFDEVSPKFAIKESLYHDTLLESKYKDVLEKKIGKVAFKNMELTKRSTDERLVPLMQEENALATAYENLVSRASISFGGGTYNISQLSKFTTSADRKVRKEATAALDAYFASVTDEIDDIFDKMVKNRTRQANILGMKSYTELSYCHMRRNSYGAGEVERLRDAVKKYVVPLCSNLHEKRAQRLGIASGDLHLYDQNVYFADGNPAPEGSPEEILEKGRQMYSEISPEAREFYDFMMKNELFDVLGRKNKQVGGYMEYIPKYRAPFIFANFNGTRDDIDVITHECGHAFQGYLQRNVKNREFADITMDIAEIHSMSMEYFTYGWMDMFFGDRETDYMSMHLEDSICFLPYGCMVDEFQHIIYDNPELTKQQRKAVWADLEKEYRPHICFEGTPFMAGGGYWQRQHHIFSFPFYYIDYVLASLCAMQFKIRMDEDYESAFADYVKLCKLGAKEYYPQLLSKCGLKSPFEDGVLEDIADKMRKKTMG